MLLERIIDETKETIPKGKHVRGEWNIDQNPFLLSAFDVRLAVTTGRQKKDIDDWETLSAMHVI